MPPTATASPHAAFIQILTASIIPVFESFATMGSHPSAPLGLAHTTSRPSSPGGNSDVGDVGSAATAAAAAGGSQGPNRGDSPAGGSLAEGSVAGNSIASDSIAGLNGGTLPVPSGAHSIAGGGDATVTHSMLRVIELEVAGDSEVEVDVEAAQALLPEPAVPAPDPKVVAIPPETVRQHVRRPMPRAQRLPMQALEILPDLPETTSANSSRPGSRNATRAKRESSKAKTEQQQHQLAVSIKEKCAGGDDVLRAGAPSGALGGNPYRWVVSSYICRKHAVRAGG